MTLIGGLSEGQSVFDPSNPLYLLEQALGVSQHHDGVSGTEKVIIRVITVIRINM